MITNTGMKAIRVVIQFNVSDNTPTGGIEIHGTDIRQFHTQSMPEAFNRLIVVWGTGAGHALAKAVFLHKLLCAHGRVLTASVTVKHRFGRSDRIPSHRHLESSVYQLFPLITVDGPSYDPSCCHIQYAAHIQLAVSVFQFCYVTASQIVRCIDRKLIFDQIFFRVLCLGRLWFRMAFRSRASVLRF